MWVGKRILEFNPKHPLVTGLQQAHKNRGDDSSLAETAELLYGTALLAEGDVPELSVHRYGKGISTIQSNGSGRRPY